MFKEYTAVPAYGQIRQFLSESNSVVIPCRTESCIHECRMNKHKIFSSAIHPSTQQDNIYKMKNTFVKTEHSKLTDKIIYHTKFLQRMNFIAYYGREKKNRQETELHEPYLVNSSRRQTCQQVLELLK